MKRFLATVVGLTLLGVGTLNVTGLVRYAGGPLREPNADGLLWLDTRPADQGNNKVEFTSGTGARPGTTAYTGISLRNDSQWAARVEQVRLVGATPGLRLVDLRMSLPGAPGGMIGAMLGSSPDIATFHLDTDYGPLPADLAPNASQDGRVLIGVSADQPGEYGYDEVAVDYRLGPLAFTAIQHDGLRICYVPMPAGTVCSEDPTS